MNKKICIIFLIMFVGINIFAANLTEYYFSDYENVIRIVFVFNENVNYTVNKTGNEIKMQIPNCSHTNGTKTDYNLKSGVLHTVELIKSQNNLTINLRGDNIAKYVHKKISSSNKIYYDIYSVNTPKTKNEYLNLVRFYLTVGFSKKASVITNQAKRNFSDLTSINYYWGRYYEDNKKKSRAIAEYKKVNQNSDLYNLAQVRLKKLGYSQTKVTKKQPTPKPKTTPKKNKKITKPQPKKDNYTLNEDVENLKLFAQYRKYFTDNKEAQEFLVGKAAEITGDSQEAIKYYKKVLKGNPDKSQIIYRNLYNLYKKNGNKERADFYYKLLDKKDSPQQENKSILNISINLWLALLIIILASGSVFFILKLKIKKLQEDQEYDFNNDDVDYHMKEQKSETKEEDEHEKQEESQPEVETSEKQDVKVIQSSDEVEKADSSELLATVGFEKDNEIEKEEEYGEEENVDTFKESEPKTPEAKELKEELSTMTFDDDENEPDNEIDEKENTEKDDEIEQEKTKTQEEEILDLKLDEYDQNDVITNQEEEELITDEMNYEESNIFDGNKSEEENLNFKDDEKKKEMIMELVADGWDIEAISKELQIPKREVEFIIEVES